MLWVEGWSAENFMKSPPTLKESAARSVNAVNICILISTQRSLLGSGWDLLNSSGSHLIQVSEPKR
jgi:hypothetical protein